jgi:hypothetical protein
MKITRKEFISSAAAVADGYFDAIVPFKNLLGLN